MKKITLLTFTFCSIAFASQAQIKKEAILIGGSLNFGSNKIETDNPYSRNARETGFGASIDAGKAVRDNFVIGLGFGYGYFRNRSTSFGFLPSRNDSKSARLFARSYKLLLKNFYFFGEGNIEGATSNFKNNGNSEIRSDKNRSINVAIYPGLAYSVTKHLQFETSVPSLFYGGYSWSRSANQQGVTRSSSWGAGVSLSGITDFQLGIRFLFNN